MKNASLRQVDGKSSQPSRSEPEQRQSGTRATPGKKNTKTKDISECCNFKIHLKLGKVSLWKNDVCRMTGNCVCTTFNVNTRMQTKNNVNLKLGKISLGNNDFRRKTGNSVCNTFNIDVRMQQIE